MSHNKTIGVQVYELLKDLGIETPMASGYYTSAPDAILKSQQLIMTSLGLDLEDDSLKETPHRVAKMYSKEVFYGLDYTKFPKCTTVKNKMGYDEMIAVKGIDVMSFCEHHFVPFIGSATCAYIPNTKVLGLSKFHRIVDFFSRRPQIQERLTEQIHATLKFILETEDVAVVINAEHLCVKLRGVKNAQSTTITSKLSGRFKEKPELRNEFISLTR